MLGNFFLQLFFLFPKYGQFLLDLSQSARDLFVGSFAFGITSEINASSILQGSILININFNQWLALRVIIQNLEFISFALGISQISKQQISHSFVLLRVAVT